MKLPSGVRDWLPHELRRKRETEAMLRGVFERWSYLEVQTPSFERFDVLESALSPFHDEEDATKVSRTRMTDMQRTCRYLRPHLRRSV